MSHLHGGDDAPGQDLAVQGELEMEMVMVVAKLVMMPPAYDHDAPSQDLAVQGGIYPTCFKCKSWRWR